MRFCVILRLHDEKVAEYYEADDATGAIIQAETQYPHHTVMSWFKSEDGRPTCPHVEEHGYCTADPTVSTEGGGD